MVSLNKSFLWGIIFASITWITSLYLYWQLTNSNTATASSHYSSQLVKNDQFFSKSSGKNDVLNLIVSNEIDKSLFGSKDVVEKKRKKYKSYYNSEKLIKSLQPVSPKSSVDIDKGILCHVSVFEVLYK